MSATQFAHQSSQPTHQSSQPTHQSQALTGHQPVTSPRLTSLTFLVDVGPVARDTAAHRNPGHAATVELFELAESLGYDGGWLRDHPAALVVLGALSQRTHRLGLGAWVSAPRSTDGGLPLAELATVDALSGGRLSILLGPAAGGSSVTLGEGDSVRRVLLPLDSAGPEAARRYRAIGDRVAQHPHTFDVPVLIGTSEHLLGVLAGDPLVGAAADLRVQVPTWLPAADQAQVLHDVAAYLAPELGWSRARSVAGPADPWAPAAAHEPAVAAGRAA